MSRFKFSTTDKGRCDVTIVLFTKDNNILIHRSLTFDIKPTVKELKSIYKKYKKDGAKFMRLTTTPSCMTKTYKL